MSETLGGDYIYSVLTNDSTVTGIVGTWTDSGGTDRPSIHNARKVPEFDTSLTTINFYQANTFNAAIEYFQAVWSMDCRSDKDYTARSLAFAVKDALNRVTGAVGAYTYFGTITILPTIEPVDEADVYNIPVEIVLRRR